MGFVSGLKKVQDYVTTSYETKTKELNKLESNVEVSATRCLLTLKKEIELKKVQFQIKLLLNTTNQLKTISNVYTKKVGSNFDPKHVSPDKLKEFTKLTAREAQIKSELKTLENEKKLNSLTKSLQSELGKLKEKSSLDVNDKERLSRLKLLEGKLKVDPDFLIGKMNQYQGKSAECALYSHLGGVDFLSILVKSDQNIGIMENLNKGKGNPSGLSETERVALYHYTTSAYAGINQAGRQAKLEGKEIKDPGMRACYQFAMSALAKLPNAPAVDKNGERVQLKRAYYPPSMDPDPAVYQKKQDQFKTFCDKTFVKGNIVNDGAFLSTSIKNVPSGQFNAYFDIPADSTEIPGGKLIGFPHSAFSAVDKPDEGEVLFGPNASFEVSKIEGSTVTYKFL